MEHLPKSWKKKMFKIVKRYGKKAQRNIIVASGGTGGHVFPAQSIVEILSKRYNTLWMTDKRGYQFISRFSSHQEYPQKCYILLSGPMQGTIKDKLLSLSKVAIGVLQAVYHMTKERPAAVLGFGGYVTVPAICAAILYNVPIVLHEQNAVLGQVNRLFIRFAKLVILSFPNTRLLDAKYQKKCVTLGNPIRHELWECAQNNIRLKKIVNIRILVIGGSQGAKIFDHIIPEAMSKLPLTLRKRLIIRQQVLTHNIDAVREKYKAANIICKDVSPFFTDIGHIMSDSDFVIGRAGASTIAELENFMLPALLIPLATSKDNHQYFNALYLVDRQAAAMIEEKKLLSDNTTLPALLEELLDDHKLATMRKNAQSTHTTQHAASSIAVKINQLLM